MTRFLSHRDPFDANHHGKIGELGVFLKDTDFEVPLVMLLIRKEVKEMKTIL